MDLSDLVDISTTDEWRRLAEHYSDLRNRHLRDLFADDPERGRRMTLAVADLLLDYSKHRVTDETLSLLAAVARRAGVEALRDAMFAGEHINTTEDRAVGHVALRMPRGSHFEIDGRDVVPDVHQVLDRMAKVAGRIRSGEWTGQTGQPIATVINIGIGGSDLGPAMAYQALADFKAENLSCRFVSNVDPIDLYQKTHDLDPATTLFVVSSKTFTTLETLTNATAARRLVARRARTPATRRWPVTSSRSRPTAKASPSSGSTPTTCSNSGSGSAAATRSIPPSASP